MSVSNASHWFFCISVLSPTYVFFAIPIPSCKLECCFSGMYQIREANQMVEEFMLAANVSVAEKVLKHFPFCSMLRYNFMPYSLTVLLDWYKACYQCVSFYGCALVFAHHINLIQESTVTSWNGMCLKCLGNKVTIYKCYSVMIMKLSFWRLKCICIFKLLCSRLVVIGMLF